MKTKDRLWKTADEGVALTFRSAWPGNSTRVSTWRSTRREMREQSENVYENKGW